MDSNRSAPGCPSTSSTRGVDQSGLHPQPHPSGGQLHRAPQLRKPAWARPVRGSHPGVGRVSGTTRVVRRSRRARRPRRPPAPPDRRPPGQQCRRRRCARQPSGRPCSSSWSTARSRRPEAGSASNASTSGSAAPETSTERAPPSVARRVAAANAASPRCRAGHPQRAGRRPRGGPTTCRCQTARRCRGRSCRPAGAQGSSAVRRSRPK